jgi:hypothetical protein
MPRSWTLAITASFASVRIHVYSLGVTGANAAAGS